MKKTILTQAAYNKLVIDYDKLIEKRALIAEEIKVARDFGDTSENAEYTAAREAQSHNETEIQNILAILNNHEIVKTNTKKNEVSIGSTLKIEYLDCNDVEQVTISTVVDSDPMNGLISHESPLGKALMGKKKNEVTTMHAPDGEVDIKVLEFVKSK